MFLLEDSMVGLYYDRGASETLLPFTCTTFTVWDVAEWKRNQKQQQADPKAIRDIQSRIKDREGWKLRRGK